MFKVGSIRKIQVKNFVTYSYVELYPGPNLNMLIGPNGTGKSTIVAAIILGLGGNPKVVGRGTKVSEYVKHNCTDATINIFLQEEREQDHLKITRTFNVQDRSSWFLNNQKVTVKEVLDCIKQYNIQVDNLCQFLPQDRVQDFAKLNQQQLLRETQLALCRSDLLEKQESLITCGTDHKTLNQSVEKYNAKLAEARDANSRLEGKIENFSKKKEFLSKIQDIDRKIAWLHYDDLYEKLAETKADLKQAARIYENHKNDAKPIEDNIKKAKNLIGELQQANSTNTRSIREQENAAKNYLEKIDQTKDRIREIENETNNQIALIEQKNQEIDAMTSKIEEMKVAQTQLITKCGNDEEIQRKVNNAHNELKKCRNHAGEMEHQKDEVVAIRQQKSAQLRSFENERNRLENVKQQRLQYLERLDRDAHEAVLWLRNNKHLFKSEVFEPIMLELNVLDAKNAIYVENVIPRRDRVAFTCVDKDDMSSLIRYLRNEKRLTVNVLYAGDRDESLSRFQPNIPIERLKRFGFYTYLNSLFTAPEPIMRYLCKTYKVHNIPIGNNQTNKHFQDLPQQITVFFSDNTRYSVNYSKYTNAKSVMQNEINSDGGLSISVDVLHLERLTGQIEELKESFANCDNQIKAFDNQINMINENISKINEEIKYINSAKQQAQAIENRIATIQRKVQEMRQTANTSEVIRTQARAKIKRIVLGMKQLIKDLKSCYKSLTVLTAKSALNSVKIQRARRDAAYLENKGEETRRLLRESEATLAQIREICNNVKGQAKVALDKAKSLSDNFTPDDDGFDAFREAHDNLPSDFAQLEEEKHQLVAKIDCLKTANDDEMREYEERVQLIDSLHDKIERAHINLNRMSTDMQKLQEEWLAPLRQLVAEINTNFAKAFERMGYAGEISINPGNDEKEFEKYGLCVKVTYRNSEPLQELNNMVQSGGERAVATAVFMLALQELTPVPFRCVDEINQGMDANNEKRIFDLLVETTSQAQTAQYFLVTPKLVPNLKFSRSTMVHIVHNGPFIEQDRKWSMSKLCNPQKVHFT